MIKLVYFLFGLVPRALLCSITWSLVQENLTENLKMFWKCELYLQPTQSFYQSWYLLISYYSEAYENQVVFMNKLNEITGECDLQLRMRW